jgi:hypothetical protein
MKGLEDIKEGLAEKEKAQEERRRAKEKVSLIGHMSDKSHYISSLTLFSLETASFLEVKDHTKLLCLSKSTQKTYISHNYRPLIRTMTEKVQSF